MGKGSFSEIWQASVVVDIIYGKINTSFTGKITKLSQIMMNSKKDRKNYNYHNLGPVFFDLIGELKTLQKYFFIIEFPNFLWLE